MVLYREALRLRSSFRPFAPYCHRVRTIATGRDRLFRVSEEVQDALATGKPVVALETTIYTHGAA